MDVSSRRTQGPWRLQGTRPHPLGVSPKATISRLSVKQHFCEDRSFPSDKISTWYFADVAEVAQSFSAKKLA
jgi:hypothetical protein